MFEGAEGAVLESSIAGTEGGEGGGEHVEIEGQQGSEGSEQGQQGTEGQDGSESQQQQQGQRQQQQGGKLTLDNLLKTSTEKLKAINPALPNFLRDVMRREQTLNREFPGGIKEALAVRDALAEFGGVEGAEETREALSDYGRLEEMYEKGDPEFMDRLAEAAPEAFSRVMPAGLERWRATDPEMYSHVLAKVIVNTLDGAKISDQLAAIYQSAEKPEMKEAVSRIWQIIEGYRQTAEKAPQQKAPDPRQKQLDQREQRLTQQEQQAKFAPVKTAGIQHITKVVDREMAQSYQWADADPDIQQAIRERVQHEMTVLSKKTGFDKEVDRLIARGDAKNLQRRIEAFQDKHIPQILPRISKLFAIKPKAAAKTNGQQQQRQGQGQQQQRQPDRGWEQVSKIPSAGEIDRSKTDADMILSNKAILKNGRKVQWP